MQTKFLCEQGEVKICVSEDTPQETCWCKKEYTATTMPSFLIYVLLISLLVVGAGGVVNLVGNRRIK